MWRFRNQRFWRFWRLGRSKGMDNLKNEWKRLCKVLCKELKILFIIFIYTFILILLQIWLNKWNFQEVLEILTRKSFNINLILSNLISIAIVILIITAIRLILVKLNNKFIKYIRAKLKIKLSEIWYPISTTLLDRIAAIALAGLGVLISLSIYLQIFYSYLDNGKFSSEVSRIDLFLLFFLYSSVLLGVNIVFKYLSEEIKFAREETGKINNAALGVALFLLLIFFLIFLFCLLLLL